MNDGFWSVGWSQPVSPLALASLHIHRCLHDPRPPQSPPPSIPIKPIGNLHRNLLEPTMHITEFGNGIELYPLHRSHFVEDAAHHTSRLSKRLAPQRLRHSRPSTKPGRRCPVSVSPSSMNRPWVIGRGHTHSLTHTHTHAHAHLQCVMCGVQ